jgi:hypothetical protein
MKNNPNSPGQTQGVQPGLAPAGWLGVFVCNQFTGHYPVGTAAVVVAKDQAHAAEILNQQLRLQGLPGDADANMMALVMQKSPQVVILCDGNY